VINNLTTAQIESIQIDYGLVYLNYGEAGQVKLGPTRGGGEFTASKNIREIEYDGRLGKTKGMQVIDEINALLKVGLMDTTLDTIGQLLPHADYDGGTGKITNNTGGVIGAAKYLKNVTMFAKVVGGGYKKITLFNAMNEADFVLSAAPKAEGVINYEFYAHWDAEDQDELFEIEDIANISDDTTPPTVVTSPLDATMDVAIAANLTATFSEAIKAGDIVPGNFLLLKAADGTVIAGALTYDPATKVATFDPTSDLANSTAYIWVISGVHDTAGNEMIPVAVNFTTVAP
jgi:hypothetical protein